MAPRQVTASTEQPTPTTATTNEQPTKKEPVKGELGGIPRAFAWFQSEETSLLSKISALAIAFFAVLTFGSLTGKLALSFVAAAAVVGGSCIWAATKGVLEPKSKEAPEKVVSEKEKAAIEEIHQRFIGALGKNEAQQKYEDFPVVNLKGHYSESQLPMERYTYPLTRGEDSDKRPLVTLKLWDVKTECESITTFVRHRSGYWTANIHEDENSPFAKKELITQENQESILKTIRDIVSGNHSKHILIPFVTEG